MGGKKQSVVVRRSPLKTALYMIGVLMILFSATMLPPMGVAWWYDGYGVVLPFAETLGATLGLGLLCWGPLYQFKIDLRNRDGFILVVAFWFLSSLLGALPTLPTSRPAPGSQVGRTVNGGAAAPITPRPVGGFGRRVVGQ